MTLRAIAEQAARELAAQCVDDEPVVTSGHVSESAIADAIERECKAFAEKALKQIYEVDGNDQWSSDGERARGGFSVKSEYAGHPGVEWRHYRADFEKMIAAAIAEADKG